MHWTAPERSPTSPSSRQHVARSMLSGWTALVKRSASCSTLLSLPSSTVNSISPANLIRTLQVACVGRHGTWVRTTRRMAVRLKAGPVSIRVASRSGSSRYLCLPLSCPRTRGCGHPAEAVPGCSECRRTWPGETAERLADRGGVGAGSTGAPPVRRSTGAATRRREHEERDQTSGARGLLEKKRTKATRVCASGWGTRLERFADNVNAGFKGSRRVNVAEPSGTGCSGLSSGRTPAVVEPGRSCVRAAQAQRREPS